MISKLYKFILFTFIFYFLSVNAVSYFAGKGSFFNIYNLYERGFASFYLGKHILFESGVVLKPEDSSAIQKALEEASGVYGVDIDILNAMVSYSNGSIYGIDTFGNMGLLSVSRLIVNEFKGLDPFIMEDNIEMGLSYLSNYLSTEEDVELILYKYYIDPKIANSVYSSYLDLLVKHDR